MGEPASARKRRRTMLQPLQVDDHHERMTDGWESNDCLSCYTLESAGVPALEATLAECRGQMIEAFTRFTVTLGSKDIWGRRMPWIQWHDEVVEAFEASVEAFENMRRVGCTLAKRCDYSKSEVGAECCYVCEGVCTGADARVQLLQAQGVYARVSPVPAGLRCPRSNEVMSDPVVGPRGTVEQRGPLRKAIQLARENSGMGKESGKKTYKFEVRASLACFFTVPTKFVLRPACTARRASG